MTERAPWRRVAFAVAAGFPFVFLAAFVAYPLWQEIGGSFSGWYQLKPHGFEGAKNYMALFNDVVARVAALHSLFYLLLTVPAEVALGLAAAWMTLRVKRGQGLLAAVFLLPLAVPWTVAGTLFYGLFNIHGVADQLSQDVFGGGSSFEWFEHPRLAFGVIVVFGIWKGAPWCFLLLLGALSACPEEVFEAARIDGARGFSFWYRVVVPAVRPMLVFVIVLRLIAEAQTYNSVAMLTNGGPSFPGATELVGFYANVLAFGYYNFGEASAMGTLIGAVLVVVAVGGWMLAFRRDGPRRRWFRGAGATAATSSTSLLHRARQRSSRMWPRSLSGDPGPARGTLRHSMRWAKRSRWVLLTVMVLLVLLPFAGEAPFWQGRNELAGTAWPAVKTGVWNTLILSAATLVGTLVLAVPAAYFLAYKQSRWRGVLFVFVLFTLAVPGIIFILPQFEEIVWLGLVNTRTGIVVLYITANLPLAVFFLRPAFASVPKPLVEAMRVDGASSLGVLRRLILRLSTSTIVALSVLMVVWVWGELPIAEAVLNSTNQSAGTLPLLLLNGGIGNPNAVYLISLGAPLVLFLAANRYFRRGLMSQSLL
ncbi:MAG TPA: ABC transporter permease subunit [Acidimicrobiales bacterium]|nr:ABC transporter permease subunit [Acidimicrobiales bacterium]